MSKNSKGFAHVLLLLGIFLFVGLGGLWLWRNGKLNIEVDGPTNTHTPTSINADDNNVPNVPTDWKTYNYSRCKFSIKYPPEWILFPEPEGAKFGAATIHSYQDGDNLEGTDWLKIQLGCGLLEAGSTPEQTLDKLNSRDDGFGMPDILDSEKIIVNGFTAYKQTIDPYIGKNVLEYYIFPPNNTVISLGFTPNETDFKSEIDQILSSFEFVE